MKKRILILLAVFSITSVITACSREVKTERTDAEKTTTKSTDHSEPLGEDPQHETGTEPEQTTENGTGALLQYRDQLEFCDLSGTRLIYEEMETEVYNNFMTMLSPRLWTGTVWRNF